MSSGINRFRTWYSCARLPGDVRAQAQRIDAYLYSPRGLWIWAVLLALVAVNAYGLYALGFPSGWAVGISLLFFVCMAHALLEAWLQPDRFGGRRLWRIAGAMVLASYAGAFGSLFGMHSTRPLPQSLDAWLAVLWRATPLQLMAGLGVLLLLWAVGAARRVQLQRELARLRLEHERDTAARQASEARLKLLQAQIQPHFLFNTLAALQHWVDNGDARAPGLLRAMTAFLRGSTELLGRSEAPLAEEAEMARHYLDVMRARLGERLRFAIELEEDCRAQRLPPGLLITLVENAVEHGIEPSLHGGSVQVRAWREASDFVLSVSDDGAGLALGWREGVGLANTRERLAHAYGERATLSLGPRTPASGVCALIRIADAQADNWA
jgi:C4-dicarboxylate-specific signal transduction histidine kinase